MLATSTSLATTLCPSSNCSALNVSAAPYACPPDPATNTVVTTVSIAGVGQGALGLAVSPVGPDAGHVYVTSENGLSVIDPTTDAVTANISLDRGFGVAVSPTGPQAGYVYVTSGQSPGSTVWVIDPATDTVVATLAPAGGAAAGVAVSPTGPAAGNVYVANLAGTASTVSVIDPTNTLTDTITSGHNSYGVAVSPTGDQAGFVYITNLGGGGTGISNASDRHSISTG